MQNTLKGKRQSAEHIRKRVESRLRNENYKHSEETKKKISDSEKGRQAWNKGLKGYRHSGSFQKGHKPYTKSGSQAPNWKGDKVKYRALHQWLEKEFGKADRCENTECDDISIKYNWSLLRGKKYERRRENFWRLCRKCHLVYDEVYEKRRKT